MYVTHKEREGVSFNLTTIKSTVLLFSSHLSTGTTHVTYVVHGVNVNNIDTKQTNKRNNQK